MDTEQHCLILMAIVWALYDGKVSPSPCHCLRFSTGPRCVGVAGSSEYLIKLFSNNHALLCWTQNTRPQAASGGRTRGIRTDTGTHLVVPTTLAGAEIKKSTMKTRATPFSLRILVLIFQITHHQSSPALTNVDGEVDVDMVDVDDDVRYHPHRIQTT